jgi:hypothetical protein
MISAEDAHDAAKKLSRKSQELKRWRELKI